VRVGLVTPRARAVDGWGRYATALARTVPDCGIEPVLVTADETVDPELAAIEHHAVLPPLFTRRFETPRSLFAVPRVRRVLSTCAVVHGIAEPYMPLLALACRSDQPYVQTAHGTWAVRPLASAVQRQLHGRSLQRVDLLVSQSQYTCDAMAAHVRLPRHVVLPGGVHAQDFAAPSTASLPEWASRSPIVVTVGHVKPRKGIHVTLEAVALARRRHATLRLVVVGPCDRQSAYRDRLERQADALGMRDAFHLRGEVSFEELVGWYQAADVFMLLPVHDHGAFEGLGLVYLEAAAAGVPSIGTRECGAAEAIADGATGVLVPPDDPEAAAEALCRLLDDTALRANMAASARARAHVLSWTRLAESLTEHYRGLRRARAGL
jgi:phosphatidylinositol alpha-1,6-mannosyltransferase